MTFQKLYFDFMQWMKKNQTVIRLNPTDFLFETSDQTEVSLTYLCRVLFLLMDTTLTAIASLFAFVQENLQ